MLPFNELETGSGNTIPGDKQLKGSEEKQHRHGIIDRCKSARMILDLTCDE